MQIRKITIGIKLFGNDIYFKYLAYVRYGQDTNTFIPIGREIQYTIDGKEYNAFLPLPIIIYHTDHNAEIMEDKKFDELLRHFSREMERLDMNQYKDEGIKMEYINQEKIIDKDPRVVTLIRGRPPQQDQIRVLIDISDQLGEQNPNADVKITFYITGQYQDYVTIDKKPFYIKQITTQMQYKYYDHYVLFFNKTIGFFRYDIITGQFDVHIYDDFQQQLLNEFVLNYPNAINQIEIYTMVLEPQLNFRSLLYN